MRFGEIFRFEIRHRLRQPSTWLYAVILLLLAFWRVHEDAWDAPDGMYSAAPESLAEFSIVLSLIGLMVTAAIFGGAASRDVGAGIHPLVYTTPLREREYLGGRFVAAFVVNALLLTLVPLGMVIASSVPYLDAAKLGPFRAVAYLQPYLLFVLPNLVLAGAILFAIAALTRHTLPAYLGGIGLLFGYLAGGSFLGDGRFRDFPGGPTLTALLDPFGLAAVQELTRYWTIVERNNQLIGFPPVLIWNRVVWMLVAVAVLWLLHRRFRFEHVGERDRRRQRRRMVAEPDGPPAATVALPRVAGTFDAWAPLRQTLAISRLSAREVVRSKALVAGLVWATLIIFNFGFSVGTEVFGTSTWPVTHLIAGSVLDSVAPIVVLLIAVLAGELVWWERETGTSEIADATPVADAASFMGRLLAMVAVLVVLQAAFFAAGVLVQAIQGYYRFELGLYARILFGIRLLDFTLLAALAMTVHVLVNHKYLGNLIVVLCFVFTRTAGALHPIRHNLLVYGGDPGWVYSDMNGFGPFAAPYLWFNAYWAAWALLLGVLGRLLWVRGSRPGLRGRIREGRARLAGATARVAVAAGASIAILGAFVFYNTNVLNDYRTPSQSLELQAEYERRYKRYEDTAPPLIVAADVRVEIYPDAGAVDLHGAYELVNRAATPIDTVPVTIHPGVRARSIAFDRRADPLVEDTELGFRVYGLERPLEPGDSLRLEFDVAYRPRGFPDHDVPTAVVRNGAYFDRRWLPILGYLPSREVASDASRQLLGLAPRAPLPSPFVADAEALRRRSDTRDADLVDAEVIIGTATDQMAITPGTLLDTWTENGRRYFRYGTDEPTSFGMAIFSAAYAVREDEWRPPTPRRAQREAASRQPPSTPQRAQGEPGSGQPPAADSEQAVALRIYHHPTHTVNLDRMIRSMKASLEYFAEQFGPYPHGELRIVEFPRYESFARAHPQTIAFSEGSAFLTRVAEGDIDLPFLVVAHETAHQWWGGMVSGANVLGAPFLTESLASYSAMMVMETVLGREQARDYYAYQMDRYLSARGRGVRGEETTLLEVSSEPFVYYGKGAVALYMLREHIGADAVSTALRRYLEKYRDAGPPYPTSLDLYAELRAVTPASLHTLLRDLFEEITLWDVRAHEAQVEPAGDEGYRVTLAIEAKKLRSDGVGNETEVPMDDLVEIGIFGPAGRGTAIGETLYLQRHRIRSGTQTITVTVPRQPARAGIDPYGKLIQRDAGDNRVDVDANTGGPPGR